MFQAKKMELIQTIVSHNLIYIVSNILYYQTLITYFDYLICRHDACETQIWCSLIDYIAMIRCFLNCCFPTCPFCRVYFVLETVQQILTYSYKHRSQGYPVTVISLQINVQQVVMRLHCMRTKTI